MKLTEIAKPISSLSGVGEAAAKKFAKLNIFTVADLLTHYPRDWEDRTKRVSLRDYQSAAKVHTLARVVGHSWFGFGRMRTLKISIFDGTAAAELICFNRPFLEKSFPLNSIIRVTGGFFIKYNELQSSAFDIELVSTEGNLEDFNKIPSSGVYPIYPLTANMTQQFMRKTISQALREYARGIANEIPIYIIEKYNLMSKQEAICGIHQPKTLENALQARNTLIFEELYLFQLAIGERSIERRGTLPSLAEIHNKNNTENLSENSIESTAAKDATRIDTEFEKSLSPKQKQLVERLPFSLTKDQKKVLLEIHTDMDKAYSQGENKATPFAMARLLQGDVGSGKTLVAFLACLRIIDYGGQCAMLAPTELLSRQHAENAARLLSGIAELAFLTGNLKAQGRRNLLSELKNGSIDIVIGTHALFSQDVVYKNLRLAIIDEQHRFGVLQRNAIIAKGRKPDTPHVLLMSATPIPQTLALTVFGDLDTSIIRTMPGGRKAIQTHLTKHGSEKNVFDFVHAELSKGRQAYFVYPLIEASENMEGSTANLKNAQEMYEYLSTTIFPQYACALIHSQVEQSEQRDIMSSFRENKIQILVATSVVEVGVDVPNATCMVIEHAERFGLAALHQLRGRVGRGEHQSHCFLVYAPNLTDVAKKRLKALYESTDGFYIAEQDLELRGPGEILGVQQSGYLTLAIADPVRDRHIMENARIEAFSVLRNSYAT